jgi:hypothetical protein
VSAFNLQSQIGFDGLDEPGPASEPDETWHSRCERWLRLTPRPGGENQAAEEGWLASQRRETSKKLPRISLGTQSEVSVHCSESLAILGAADVPLFCKFI